MLTLIPDNMKKGAFYKNRKNMPSRLRSFQPGFNKLAGNLLSRFVLYAVENV